MQDAGIKLTSVASSLLTMSGRAMLEALIGGERDPEVLASLAKGRLRSKIPQLREALEGRFRIEHHGVMVAQILAHVDFLEEWITAHGRPDRGREASFAETRKLIMTILECANGSLTRCPGNYESGGRRKDGRTRKESPWLRTALTEAAHAASSGSWKRSATTSLLRPPTPHET